VRVYTAADAAALRTLRDGGTVTLPAVVATSEDEEDEFDALLEAAASGSVVVVAEVDRDDQPVSWREVQAFHVDADESGDLAWYAPHELEDVLAVVTESPDLEPPT
jgi:hypothetical protein